MKKVLLALATLFLFFVGFAIWYVWDIVHEQKELERAAFARISVLQMQLEAGEEPDPKLVMGFAEDYATREATWELLATYDRPDLFPAEYATTEKSAETALANWLNFPTELDTFPSKMEHLEAVELKKDGKTLFYHAFRFKTDPPHFASVSGWIIGVAGPYTKNSAPFEEVSGVFSRFIEEGKTTARAEANWVQGNIVEGY